jgi:hypothetical protein
MVTVMAKLIAPDEAGQVRDDAPREAVRLLKDAGDSVNEAAAPEAGELSAIRDLLGLLNKDRTERRLAARPSSRWQMSMVKGDPMRIVGYVTLTLLFVAVGCETKPSFEPGPAKEAAQAPIAAAPQAPVTAVRAPTPAKFESHEIRFKRGARSATVKAAVIRGQSDFYHLSANAEQVMTVSVTALENNAVFAIYAPGYAVEAHDGAAKVKGQTLAGAGEADDATTWKGGLPTSGRRQRGERSDRS